MTKNASETTLHPRNRHINGYNLSVIRKNNPKLKAYIFVNKYKNETIDFADPNAVFELNKGLLLTNYKIKHWEIAKNSLCPAIPGRADYIHYLADLLGDGQQVPTGGKIKVLDIGTGSSLIYPILGAQEYEWDFIASEIDQTSIQHAENNLNRNVWLKKKIQLRHQQDKQNILKGVIFEKESFDAIMCNPPFYKSREDNWNSSTKKFNNLHKKEGAPTVQNFGGHPNELWCDGGEKKFITSLINESLHFRKQIKWTTSLVADKDHLKPLRAVLEYNKAAEIRVISMKQGQKISRILAWRWD